MPEPEHQPALVDEASFTLASIDGVDLFVYRWLPPQAPKAVVQIAHGMAEHGARYARLAAALTAAGYAVYANDHRGHGRTAKTPEQLGFFGDDNGWRKCLDDLWLVNREIAADHPGVPVVLLGHSMGSTMAQQFVGEHGESLAGVILSGPNGQPPGIAAIGRLIARMERLRLGSQGHSRTIHNMTFTAFNKQFAPARTAFDWLSRDANEVDKYVADPLCGFSVSVQLWIELLDAWASVSRPAWFQRVPRSLPVLVIAGQRDPVSQAGRQIDPMLAAFRAAGLQDLEHRLYPDARHELFNETNRDEVTGHVIAWLDRITRQDPEHIASKVATLT
jgi:alpha-beta hydrolase superfamily lysophospholipase